jgi:hypothetical protein
LRFPLAKSRRDRSSKQAISCRDPNRFARTEKEVAACQEKVYAQSKGKKDTEEQAPKQSVILQKTKKSEAILDTVEPRAIMKPDCKQENFEPGSSMLKYII